MFKIQNATNKNLIAIKISGKIKESDYNKITPLIEKAVEQYGKVKLYLEIENIEGIEPKAFREDVKTYIKHFNHIAKIAVVGKNNWQKMWSNLASPFVSGQVKYFPGDKALEATKWIME